MHRPALQRRALCIVHRWPCPGERRRGVARSLLSLRWETLMPSALFEPIRLRGLELPNRIMVSPMCQYIADDGCANDWHLMHLGQYSMGAAGLVCVEATHVSRAGRITHGCLGLYSD